MENVDEYGCKSDCFGILPDGEPCHIHRRPSCRENAKKIEELIEAGQGLVGKGYSVLNGTDALKIWREVSGTEKGSSL